MRAAVYATAILATSAGWLAYQPRRRDGFADVGGFRGGDAGSAPRRAMPSSLIAGMLLGLAVSGERAGAAGALPPGALVSAPSRFAICVLRFRRRHVDRGALVRAGDVAQRRALLRGVLLEASLRPLRHRRAAARAAVLVLCARTAGRAFSLDARCSCCCFSKRLYQGSARRVSCWPGSLWGFVFFSVSRNKLPGYLLPLIAGA